MEFLGSQVWWGLVAGASFIFALWFRFGASRKSGNTHQIGRLAYFALVTYAFMANDWTGGVAICLVSSVIGQFVPPLLNRMWVRPLAEAQTHTSASVRSVEPL